LYDKNKASIQDDKTMENDEIKRYTDILRMNKNIILQGAPGTGKTYNTAALALSLIDENISYSNHFEMLRTALAVDTEHEMNVYFQRCK